ncbi:MAG: helix-turn-helix domain-containing protein [Byssovorax sp.]
MSNALPLLAHSTTVPSARSFPTPAPRSYTRLAPPLPPPPPVAAPPLPKTTAERMIIARERIRTAAEAGKRVRSYEIALSVDMSEFHFARQFRCAFGRSPHVYYDEVRAEVARNLLQGGMNDSEVARRVGFRRPAELRALLSKRAVAI